MSEEMSEASTSVSEMCECCQRANMRGLNAHRLAELSMHVLLNQAGAVVERMLGFTAEEIAEQRVEKLFQLADQFCIN